jgi:hypothetical protein
MSTNTHSSAETSCSKFQIAPDNYLDTTGDLAEHPRQCIRTVLATCGDWQGFGWAAFEGVKNGNNLHIEREKEIL